MSSGKKKMEYVVRGFDASSKFSRPTGVMSDLETFTEQVVKRQHEAIAVMLLDDVMKESSASFVKENLSGSLYEKVIGRSEDISATDNFHVIDLEIFLDTTDKIVVRNLKSDIRECLIHWAEKSRIKGCRGFRSHAIRTPKYVYEDNGTYVKTQVILSNAIFYADDIVDIMPRTDTHILNDVLLLQKKLSSVLPVIVNVDSFGI